MANQWLRLPDDSANAGKRLASSELTIAATTVNREQMVICGEGDLERASVIASAPSTEYGLVTRNIPSGTQNVRLTDGTNVMTGLFDIDTGGGTQFVQGISIRISGAGGSIEAKGQQTMANSIPVVLSSDQSAISVNAGTNLNTSALNLEATQADVRTSVQLIDDTVFIDDTSTHSTGVTKVIGIGATAVPTDTSLNANDIGMPAMSLNRELYSVIPTVSSTGSLGALNDVVSVSLDGGRTGASVAITAGSLTGTIKPEVSHDNGTTWRLTELIRVGPGLSNLLTSLINPASGIHEGFVIIPGVTNARVRVTAYTSGSCTATVRSMVSQPVPTPLVYDWSTGDAQFMFENASNGALRITNMDAAGNDRGANVNASNQLSVSVDNTIATNLGKAEDAAHVSGDIGVMALTVRSNTAAATSGTDGDYQPPISNTRGATWVAIEDGAGGQVTSFGGTQYVEDAVAAANPTGTVQILVRKDTPADEVSTDGDNIAHRSTKYGAAYVQVVNSSGSYVDTFGGSGGTAQADNSAFTAGTTTATPVAGFYHSTIDTVTDGRAAAAAITTKRALHVNLRDNSGAEITALPITDNAGSLTVDGTVTVNGTVTATIAAGASTIAKAEDAASANADVGVPSMAIQLATPTDLAGTDADYAILQMAGGRLWTSSKIDTALPAGANAIGKLAANSGVTIGAVEIAAAQTLATVTTVSTVSALGTSTTGPQKAEDVASANADIGIPAMMVQKATPANTAGTDGDYEFLQGSNGRLWVDPSGVTLTVASHAVTNAGTFVVQENGTQVQVDDAAFTPATSKIVMVGFEADESSTDSVDEGDGGAARMTLDRKVIITAHPHTQGGLKVLMATGSDGSTALTSTAQVIKASAGQVYGWYIYNPNATAQFVHLYNTAQASVTVGTTNPQMSLTIPATSAANILASTGIEFTNAGFSIAATSTAGGNGAPSTALDAVIFYF